MSPAQEPVTLLTIHKDVRFMIWDLVFTEVEYTANLWCPGCRRLPKNIIPVSRFRYCCVGCKKILLWLCQPSQDQTGLVLVNKQLHKETLPFTYRAAITYQEPAFLLTSPQPGVEKDVKFRQHIIERMHTFGFPNPLLASLGPATHPQLAARFPNLKRVVLTNFGFLDFRYYSMLICRGIQEVVHKKALRLRNKVEENIPTAPKLSKSFAMSFPPGGIPGTWASPYRNAWQSTVEALANHNIKIEFPVTYKIVAMEILEWPFESATVLWDGEPNSQLGKILKTTAVWDRTGLRFDEDVIPDMSKQDFFWEWNARHDRLSNRGMVDNAVWAFGHLEGNLGMAINVRDFGRET